jgi:hypothetical protein
MLVPYVSPEDLTSAVLHLGRVPWYLPRRFCAVVRGTDVYFRSPACDQDGGPAWIAMLGHELTHVGQYRKGMTAFGYLCSTVFGYKRSRFEREAFAVQARILEDLSAWTGSFRADQPDRAKQGLHGHGLHQ